MGTSYLELVLYEPYRGKWNDLPNRGQAMVKGYVVEWDQGCFEIGGACCLTNGTCLQLASQSLCDGQSGTFHGLGSSCGGDIDGDSIADTCDQCPYDPTNQKTPEGQCIPTVSQWGIVVMALLLLSGGAVVAIKRKVGESTS